MSPSDERSEKGPTGIDKLLARTVKVEPTPTRPSSYYLKPKSVGQKIKTTGAKIQSEDEVVKQCVDYLRKNGWTTKTLFTGGIPVGNGRFVTNPAKGIPDSINFHIGTKRCVWIEYKKSHNGLISPEQKDWHNLLKHCGYEIWVVNSLKCLKEFLDETIATAS